jgi:hypothetical protein
MNGREGPPGSRAEPVGSGIPAGQDRRRRRLGASADNPSLHSHSQASDLIDLTNALAPAAWDQLRKEAP